MSLDNIHMNIHQEVYLMLTRTFFARAPLNPGRFAPLPAGAITARGALRDHLLALRGGLLSRCASIFPHTGAHNFSAPITHNALTA